MSLKSSKELKANRYELEVEVSAEDFEKAIEKAFKKQAKNITVPGFRKGKAPRGFIEKYYGKEIFFEDAISEAYPEALEQAIDEAGLEFIEDQIDFDVKEVSKEKGLVFVAAVTTKPEVEVKNYKGIEVHLEDAKVSKEEINKEIDNIRERNSRMITVEDRAAKKDDIAVFDFEGFVDGKAFDGGKADNFQLTLGSGQFIAGFEDQIIGHNAGDEFDVNVTFPEEYQAKELQGKDAVFKCKLHEIKERKLPELDDEFVKDVSEVDTVEEYKKEIESKLAENKNKDIEQSQAEQITTKLSELVEGEIPQAMYENKIREAINDFSYQLQAQGLKLDDYMKFTGMDTQKLKESYRERCEIQVKARLALEKIAKLEKIEVSEEEINERIDKLSKDFNMSVEQIEQVVARKMLKDDLISEKTMDFLKKESKNLGPEKKEDKKSKKDNK